MFSRLLRKPIETVMIYLYNQDSIRHSLSILKTALRTKIIYSFFRISSVFSALLKKILISDSRKNFEHFGKKVLNFREVRWSKVLPSYLFVDQVLT